MLNKLTQTIIISLLLLLGVFFILAFSLLLLFELSIIITNICLTRLHKETSKIVNAAFTYLYKDFV